MSVQLCYDVGNTQGRTVYCLIGPVIIMVLLYFPKVDNKDTLGNATGDYGWIEEKMGRREELRKD